LISHNGTKASSDADKAAVLNQFFCSVFTKKSLRNIPEFPPREFANETDKVYVTPELVRNKLKFFNPSKSSVPDELHPKILQETVTQLSVPLTIIFNKSLQEGVVPEDWRVANIIPIFKKGNHSNPTNYRPISLTSVVLKILESILQESIIKHMLTNHLIVNEQHGFLPKKSCVTKLFMAMKNWTDMLHTGYAVDVLHVNFKKAFDLVPHIRLLIKEA